MNTSLKAAVASVALLSSVPTFAATQGQMLTQCKELAKSQIENVERIKYASIKNRKNQFSAKLRIRTADDSAIYACTIERGGEPTLARLDKPEAEQVAAKKS